MNVHKSNIALTDDHQSAYGLFSSYSYDPKQNRSTAGFQTFDTGPFILSLKRTTKAHIAKIFNPFMLGGNKRAYILK